MSSEKQKEKGSELMDGLEKLASAAIVPAALSISLLTGGAAVDADDISQYNSSAITAAVSDSDSDEDSEAESTEAAEAQSEQESPAYGRLARGSALSAASSAAVSGAAAGISSFASELLQGVGLSLLKAGVAILSVFVCLFTLFCALYKAVYPEKSLREFIKPKNTLYIFIGSLICYGAYRFLMSLDRNAPVWWIILYNLFVALVILSLWYKTFALRGRIKEVLSRLFWGKRGKLVLCAMLSGNLLCSAVRILYSEGFGSTNAFSAIMFYFVCLLAALGIFALCAGRMKEE